MAYTAQMTAQSSSFPTWDDLIEDYSDRRDSTYQNVILDAIQALAAMTNLNLNFGDVYSDYPTISDPQNLWLFSLLNQPKDLTDHLNLLRFLVESF